MPAHVLRPEVLEFIRATEDLLSPSILESHFTTKECNIVGYYLMAMSSNLSPTRLMRYRLGMQSVRVEIANFEQAAQSLIAITMLSSWPLSEEEQVIVAYFLTRLQGEFVFPGD